MINTKNPLLHGSLQLQPFLLNAFCIVVFLLCSLAQAQSVPRVLDVATDSPEPIILTPYLYVLPDPDAALTLEQVLSPSYAAQFQAQDSTSEALSYGFTRSAHWFRLTLQNNSDRPTTRLFELANYRARN
jgi:hypothetical protein